jgi:chemotaxis signal transduction protein
VVDAVSDVADIPAEQIEPRTAARAGRAPMVRGLGKRADRVSFILDVPALLAIDGAVAAPGPSTPASVAR